MGLTVDSAEAFDSITLTFNDNSSGMQWFDEVICTPEPSSFVLLGLGAVGLLAYGWRRRRR